MMIKNIVDINYTINKNIFLKYDNFWELLPNIKNYIIELGNSLDKEKYIQREDNVWISISAKVSDSAKIIGPCIIDENAEIRHCAFIRGSVIVGKNCVIGNSCEIKNAIIFDNSQIPHFNYVGDSILGYKTHLGAGVILSNQKSDKSIIKINNKGNIINTNLTKMGSIIGNHVEVGCNSVLNPGTIIKPNTTIYPLTRIRGVIEENSIVKDMNTIIKKEDR